MPQVRSNGVALEYERHGDPGAEAILLVMAVGAQMTHWPQALIDPLVAAGYQVIAYDSRDIGLSEKMVAAVPSRESVWKAMRAGECPAIPYRIEDLVRDAVGLLDGLGIERAHLVGLSFGSWIAQLVAADHPERVLSLTMIASGTGNPDLPPPAPEALAVLSVRAPDPNVDYEGYIEHWVKGQRVLGSPTYPKPDDEVRKQADRDFRRCFDQDGADRQILAAMTAGDRRAKLRTISAPTVVIHGAEDRLVPLAAGEDAANTIPGAELVVLEHMAHELPSQFLGEISEAILRAAGRSRQAREPVDRAFAVPAKPR